MPHITDNPGSFLTADRDAALVQASNTPGVAPLYNDSGHAFDAFRNEMAMSGIVEAMSSGERFIVTYADGSTAAFMPSFSTEEIEAIQSSGFLLAAAAPNSAGGGYSSQVGSYFGNYMLGVAESPWTLLKGVGRGYAEIGALVADATTGQFWRDLGTMATNPGATVVSTVQVGANIVTGTVASFADGRNLGNFVGGAAFGSVALPGSLSTLSNASKGAIGEATSLVTNLARGNIPIGSQVPISVAGRTPVIDWQFQNVFTGSVTLVESKFGTAGLTSAQRPAAPLLTVEKWTYPFWSNVGTVGGAAGGATGSGKGP